MFKCRAKRQPLNDWLYKVHCEVQQLVVDERRCVCDCMCMTGFGPMHAEDGCGLIASTLSLLYTPTPIYTDQPSAHSPKKKKKRKIHSYEMLKHDNAATPLTKNEFDRTYSSPLQVLSNSVKQTGLYNNRIIFWGHVEHLLLRTDTENAKSRLKEQCCTSICSVYIIFITLITATAH